LESQTEEDWSLVEHLTELRNRLLISLAFFIPCLGVAFYLAPKLIFCFESLAPLGTIFFQLKPGELLFVYFRLSFTLGLILGAPVWLYQLGAFLWPGLKPKEKQIASVLLIGGTLLFLAGVFFAYFVALKPLLAFILGFGVDLNIVKPQYGLDYFVSMVTAVIFIMGLAFQLPVLIFVLALLDLIDSKMLLGYWRQAIFGAFVLAAVLTPTPDPFNMLILGSALMGLYGFSLLAVKLIGK
jgi:sec-independent protein translocase protein TatC